MSRPRTLRVTFEITDEEYCPVVMPRPRVLSAEDR